jgi:hypothetical protein
MVFIAIIDVFALLDKDHIKSSINNNDEEEDQIAKSDLPFLLPE